MMIQTTQFVKEPFDVTLSVVQWLEQLSNIDSLASYIDEALPPEQGGEIPYIVPDPRSNPPDPGGETPKIAPSNPPDPGPETPKIAPDPSSQPPDPGPQDPK